MPLNYLQAARQTSEKVRLPLKKKIRTNNKIFYPEDKVYRKHTHERAGLASRDPGKVSLHPKWRKDSHLLYEQKGANWARVWD